MVYLEDTNFDIKKVCLYCGAEITKSKHKSKSKFEKQRFCSIECYNLYKGGDKSSIEIKQCLNCKKDIPLKNLSKKEYEKRKFCSNECQMNYKHKEIISAWKSGEFNGIVGSKWKDLSRSIRTYLFNKYENKCARCGWSEINPYTGTLPLEIEHIDGDAINNKEENLILLCPNCHSLTSTYKGANKGNGKRNVKWMSRDFEYDLESNT